MLIRKSTYKKAFSQLHASQEQKVYHPVSYF